MLKRGLLILTLCLAVSGTLSCSSVQKGRPSSVTPQSEASGDFGRYDVVLEGQPMRARKVKPGTSSDAVAENESQLTGIVVLKITRMLKGRLSKLVIEPPSLGSRFEEAVKEKKYLAAVFDSFTPQEAQVIERTRISVAVNDPAASFGVTDWDTPVPDHYRLYLKRYKDQPNTYIMVKKEKVETPSGAGE